MNLRRTAALLTLPILATMLACVGPTPAQAAWSCPTRQNTIAGDPADVVPPTAGGTILDADLDPRYQDVRRSLQQETKYLLTTNDDNVATVTGNNELAIRVPAMNAFTLAVALRTNGYAPSITGVTNTDAVTYLEQIVNRISCQHKDVSADPGWGKGWQTAHWAFLTGMAAWLEWGQMTAREQDNVVAMVKGEADRLATIAPTYWKSPGGVENYPGDSKAEELAWNAELLLFAHDMMPSADTSNLWRRQAVEYAAAAYAIRRDASSAEVVNGVSMGERTNGYNVLDWGAVVNHGIIHPDYANQINLLWQGADVGALSGQGVPEAMFHNTGLVYSGLSTYSYTPGDPSPAGGTYVAPGGPVYQPDGSIYFPQGTDWGAPRRALWVSLDAHADVYRAFVQPTGTDPLDALVQHEAGQQALWASSGATDGRTYSIDPAIAAQQDSYDGREEYAGNNLATAWLAIYVQQTGKRMTATGKTTWTMPPSGAGRATLRHR